MCPETNSCGIPYLVVSMHSPSTLLTLPSSLFTMPYWVSGKLIEWPDFALDKCYKIIQWFCFFCQHLYICKLIYHIFVALIVAHTQIIKFLYHLKPPKNMKDLRGVCMVVGQTNFLNQMMFNICFKMSHFILRFCNVIFFLDDLLT